MCRFNPRPCARGDEGHLKSRDADWVSIHAPARGATPAADASNAAYAFQSTPLREGRLGCKFRLYSLPIVSIHAPARGATVLAKNCVIQFMFQSTPLREGRHNDQNSWISQIEFQSTPLREGRPVIHKQSTGYTQFQSTPLREGRLKRQHSLSESKQVSIHAPARGATRFSYCWC